MRCFHGSVAGVNYRQTVFWNGYEVAPFVKTFEEGVVSKFDQRLFGIRMERVLSEWFRW